MAAVVPPLLPPWKDTQLSLASTDNVVEERHYFV